MYDGYHKEKLCPEVYEKDLDTKHIKYVIYDKRREFENFKFKETNSAFEKIHETDKFLVFGLKPKK